jgi:hypothetical protein
MTTYAVDAHIITHDGDYSGSKSVPTFYLDSRVQGIVSEAHAETIARGILNPLGTIPAADINVRAYAVPDGPSIEARQAAILADGPYLAGETVLMRALMQEHMSR